jgi:hypothetical protein
MVHIGASLLLFLLAMISVAFSVLIAVKPAADPANSVLLRKANIAGLVESIVAGVVLFSGLIAVFMGPSSLSYPWVWMSLMIMVFYIVALVFVTKPARLVVARHGSAVKTGMQVILQIGHVLLILVGFSLMLLKPV